MTRQQTEWHPLSTAHQQPLSIHHQHKPMIHPVIDITAETLSVESWPISCTITQPTTARKTLPRRVRLPKPIWSSLLKGHVMLDV